MNAASMITNETMSRLSSGETRHFYSGNSTPEAAKKKDIEAQLKYHVYNRMKVNQNKRKFEEYMQNSKKHQLD